MVKRSIVMVLRNPMVRKELEKGVQNGVDKISEFVSTLKVKISFRIKESEFVIEATKKIEIYKVGNVNNSTVIQGKNIQVNHNTYISINISVKELKELKELNNQLKDINNKFSSQVNNIENSKIEEVSNIVNNIDDKFKKVSVEVENILSKVTDYSLLKQALNTEGN